MTTRLMMRFLLTGATRMDLAGGGALSDVGPHVVDAARFLLGDIESVQGASMATFIDQRPILAGIRIGS